VKLVSHNSFPLLRARGNTHSPMCALGLTRRNHPRRHVGEPVEAPPEVAPRASRTQRQRAGGKILIRPAGMKGRRMPNTPTGIASAEAPRACAARDTRGFPCRFQARMWLAGKWYCARHARG